MTFITYEDNFTFRSKLFNNLLQTLGAVQFWARIYSTQKKSLHIELHPQTFFLFGSRYYLLRFCSQCI